MTDFKVTHSDGLGISPSFYRNCVDVKVSFKVRSHTTDADLVVVEMWKGLDFIDDIACYDNKRHIAAAVSQLINQNEE